MLIGGASPPPPAPFGCDWRKASIEVATSIDAFLQSQPKGAGGGGEAPPISMQNARIEWRNAFGVGTALHVGDLGGDVKGNPLATDVNVHFSGIKIDMGLASIGPWSGTLVRDKDKSSVALALSQKGPDVAKLEVTRPIGGDSFT